MNDAVGRASRVRKLNAAKPRLEHAGALSRQRASARTNAQQTHTQSSCSCAPAGCVRCSYACLHAEAHGFDGAPREVAKHAYYRRRSAPNPYVISLMGGPSFLVLLLVHSLQYATRTLFLPVCMRVCAHALSARASPCPNPSRPTGSFFSQIVKEGGSR